MRVPQIRGEIPIGHPGPVPAASLTQARHYLLGRQCRAGGFCFYRSAYLEEPNLHDTWHALAALARLGTRTPRAAAVKDFAAGEPVPVQPFALYYRWRILALLGEPDPEQAAVRAAVAALAVPLPGPGPWEAPSQPLYRLRLVLWLKRRLGLPFPARAIARRLDAAEHPAGGFGTPPDVLSTAQALAVLELCGAAPSQRTPSFVAALATPAFGFRLTTDGLAPSLEATCAGVSCCRRLQRPIVYADAALGFILDCQTGDGGFARAPGALPDIGLTHLALAGLGVLADPLPLKRRRSP